MNTFPQIAQDALQPLEHSGFILRNEEGVRGIDLIFLEREGKELRIAYERFFTPALHRSKDGKIEEKILVPFEVKGGQGGTLEATHEEQLLGWFKAAVGVIAEMNEDANQAVVSTPLRAPLRDTL